MVFLGRKPRKGLPLRSTPIAKRLAAIHGARPRLNAAAIASATEVFPDPGSPEIMARTAPETLVREKAKDVRECSASLIPSIMWCGSSSLSRAMALRILPYHEPGWADSNSKCNKWSILRTLMKSMAPGAAGAFGKWDSTALRLVSLQVVKGRPTVAPHISRKTSEIPGFPVRSASQCRVCGFLQGKPHEVRPSPPSPTGNPGVWGTRIRGWAIVGCFVTSRDKRPSV